MTIGFKKQSLGQKVHLQRFEIWTKLKLTLLKKVLEVFFDDLGKQKVRPKSVKMAKVKKIASICVILRQSASPSSGEKMNQVVMAHDLIYRLRHPMQKNQHVAKLRTLFIEHGSAGKPPKLCFALLTSD